MTQPDPSLAPRWTIAAVPPFPTYTPLYRRLLEALATTPIRLQDGTAAIPPDCDALLVTCAEFARRSDLQQLSLPVFLVDTYDWCGVSEHREFLRRPNVLAMLRFSDYVNQAEQNMAGFHDAQYQGSSGPLVSWIQPAPPESLAKLEIWTGFALHSDPADWADVNWTAPRPLDVHLVLNVRYDWPGIGQHRRTALTQLGQILARRDWAAITASWGRTPVDVDPRIVSMPFSDYRQLLLISKVCVSPWGYGEFCIRDYEALLAGAVLVKPDTGFATTWPDLRPGEHYVPCRADFSDLEQAIDQALTLYPDVVRRQRLRDHVLPGTQPAAVAARLAAILDRCLTAYNSTL